MAAPDSVWYRQVRNDVVSSRPRQAGSRHLPVVIDPSQGTGHARLVPAMCRAAIAAGADGLIIEVHPDPEHALTDGAQSLTPTALTELMDSLARIATAVDRTCE